MFAQALVEYQLNIYLTFSEFYISLKWHKTHAWNIVLSVPQPNSLFKPFNAGVKWVLGQQHVPSFTTPMHN